MITEGLACFLQSLSSGRFGFDERALLCHLYDELGSWKLSNIVIAYTAADDTPTTKAFSAAFAGYSTAVAKAKASWQGDDSQHHNAASRTAKPPATADLTSELAEFSLPMSPSSMYERLDSTEPAALPAASEEAHGWELAGLPRLHASSFEILCISGLCTAAQTDEDWQAVEHHIYMQAVLFIARFNTAWLSQCIQKDQPTPYTIPPLEAHVHLIGKLCPGFFLVALVSWQSTQQPQTIVTCHACNCILSSSCLMHPTAAFLAASLTLLYARQGQHQGMTTL